MGGPLFILGVMFVVPRSFSACYLGQTGNQAANLRIEIEYEQATAVICPSNSVPLTNKLCCRRCHLLRFLEGEKGDFGGAAACPKYEAENFWSVERSRSAKSLFISEVFSFLTCSHCKIHQSKN